MPPFSFSSPAPNGFPQSKPEPNIVALNVGGQMFHTTKQTLALAGPQSLLSTLVSDSPRCRFSDFFVDRDPEIFSVILSLLRTGNLPSKAKAFDLHSLIAESEFYGVQPLLMNSLSSPSQFDAFNVEKSTLLSLNGRDCPSSIATTPCGSLHIAHGSKITSFDWSLRRKSTILTEFSAIDSLLAMSPSLAAAGATDFSGLHVLDLENGSVRETMTREDATMSGSTVQAIGSSSQYLFTSFETGRRNSSSIMVYDFQSFKPVTEVAKYEIYGAELSSAIPATKLNWVSGYNLLMASGSHAGPSGVLGNIKFWDIRSGSTAWELNDKVDCFSDVTVSEPLSVIFKVGVNSGEVFYADLRKLGGTSSWVCLGDRMNAVSGKKEGRGCKIESHGSQVFATRGGDIELWSEIGLSSPKGASRRVYRKNSMGRMKDLGGASIVNLAFGGNKMFVTRKNQQSVEVWQSAERTL